MNQAEIDLKIERQRLLETKLNHHKNLPHLYGWKWYKWAREFFESRNHYCFLVAANQVGKSSTQIRKCIHWATENEIWPTLWRSRPLQFWYLYPTKDVATIEFEKKWIPQFLPRGEYKDHPKYGWREDYKNKYIHAIHFNSGVSVYFKTYGQDVSDLQTGSVDAIFCDEELPEELYSELNMRIAATDGYFNMVFTATLGLEIWRCTMEESGKDELFPEALKRQVSMYECLQYDDGTPSHWTLERIERVKNSCKSDAEVQRRVYGRFVVDGNLKYPSFSRARNINREVSPPAAWYSFYSGTDIGQGGSGHPAAIVFVAVRPDFKYGRVFKGWRGDGITTSNGDILQKHNELRGDLKLSGQYYDWQSKDFFVIASRIGESFTAAEKGHDIGESILNVLFKNKMLDIDDIPELKPLITEIVTLKKDTQKTKAKDDFCFVAGTLITTKRGLIPIEQIQSSDLILTRDGYHPLEAWGSRLAQTVELEFSNGEFLRCTPDHPFWVQGRGFVPAEDLTPSDTLYTLPGWQKLKQSPSMGLSFEGIQNLNASLIGGILIPLVMSEKGEQKHTIGKFGSRLMGLFQKVLQYITKMGTYPTMLWKTLRPFQGQSINPNTCWSGLLKTQSLLHVDGARLVCLQPYGMVLRQAASGIKSMLRQLGIRESLIPISARYVEVPTRLWTRNLQLDSVQTSAGQRTAEMVGWTMSLGNVSSAKISSKSIDTPKQKPVVDNVVRLKGRKRSEVVPVYNLTVGTKHEYFANGILVSNCDALRYAVTKIPWDFTAITGAKLDLEPEQAKMSQEERIRRGIDDQSLDDQLNAFNPDEELDAWDELMNTME